MSARSPSIDEEAPVVARPAAAVVLLREGEGGCEVLLLQRNSQLAFHGGAWVFPGGRIDDADYAAAAEPTDIVSAARRAAVREAREEAGLAVEHANLVLFSRWLTPTGLPKRFEAWYFAAPAAAEPVRVDGGEILDHRWVRPEDALTQHRAGRLDLPPPTWVTLNRFIGYRSVPAALEAAGRVPLEHFEPRVCLVPAGACSLYAGDSAYDTGEVDAPGPRHRLWMLDSGWRYERTD